MRDVPHAKRLALGVVALGFGLRCLGYFDAWPNPDEGAYYAIATSTTWSAFWSEIARHTHPPGIYLLHYGLAQVPGIGDSLAWLRLPSLLGGSAAIYALFLAGRELGGDRTGLLAAALLALSPASVTLSQVLRPYGVFAAALGFGLAALFRYARRRSEGHNDARALGISATAIGAALCLHYATFLVLPAASAIVLWSAFGSRANASGKVGPLATLGAWAALSCLLLATHVLPNLLGEPIQRGAHESWLAESFHSSPLGALRALPALFQLGAGNFLAWAALLATAAGFAALVGERNWAALALTAGTLFLAIHASWLGLYPFGASRHGFHLVIALIPVAARGIDAALRRGALGAASIAAALAFSVALGIARPAPAILQERLATLADFEVPLAELEAAKADGGLWLLDRQTYRMLTPYFGRAGEARERSAEQRGIFTWFDWGSARVVVAQPWRLHQGPNEVARANHVFGALLRASRIEEIETQRFRRGLLIFGGWNLVDAADGSATPLVVRTIDWPDYIARMQPRAR